MTLSMTNLEAIINVDTIADSCDTGAGNPNAEITIYDGAVPALVDDSIGGSSALAVLQMANPAFGAGFDEVPHARADAGNIVSSTVAIAGTASYYRIHDRDSLDRIQGTVGTSGSDLNFNSVNFTLGGTVEITALAIRVLEG